MVGGEQAKNKDLKEKHRRRKRYADERRKQLVAALQKSDEDSAEWVLLNVYDSIQEEVRAKSKLLEKMQRKVRPGRVPLPARALPSPPHPHPRLQAALIHLTQRLLGPAVPCCALPWEQPQGQV